MKLFSNIDLGGSARGPTSFSPRRAIDERRWFDWDVMGVGMLQNGPEPLPPTSDTVDLAALDGANGFRIDGIDLRDSSGFAVSFAGDVNGDGFGDVIIGAYLADPGFRGSAGESYVLFGMADNFDAAVDLASLNGSNGFRLDGIAQDDQSGYSVSSAGDVNGDGFDDIIIGARRADPGGDSNAGESYVVFGKSDGFPSDLNLATLDGTNGFRLAGVSNGDNVGTSVSSAGDINGDGFDDIIIGASGFGSAGASYIVFGRESGFSASLDLGSLNGVNGFRLSGIDSFDRSGFSVPSAGDVNGDGFDDMLVGSPSGDPGGNSGAGESYVVFGKAGAFSATLSLSALDGTNGFRIDGIDASDNSGTVSSAGDFNGDGFDDIIVGASRADPGGKSDAGEAYVVFGKSSGFGASFSLSTLNGTNGFRINGVGANDGAGSSVSSAGDINGDGFDDIIVGAPGGEDGGLDAGNAYLIFGKGSGFTNIDLANLSPTSGFVIRGNRDGDNAGSSVSGAGDVNGDGFDDLIVGAPGADAVDERNVGTSYIIFGSSMIGGIIIAGGDNPDSLIGGAGNENLIGLEGDDTLRGGGGPDVLDGGGGEDWADYTGATEKVTADLQTRSNNLGDADGDIYFSIENLLGSTKADTLRGDGGGNVIDGAGGNDVLQGQDGADTLIGNDGDDTIDGGGEDDLINGDAGRDTLTGGSGDDTMVGGVDGDTLSGGDGLDDLSGGGGQDSLIGGSADDSLFGSLDGDTLVGGLGGDVLDGGSGFDWADYGAAAQKLTADLQTSANNAGEAAGDSYAGIENVRGSSFADKLRGDGRDNVLDGNLGDDTIDGRKGDDTLIGGSGADALTGGAGADWFLLDSIAGGGIDAIADFAAGEDIIALTGSVFGLGPGPLLASQFVVADQARDLTDRIIYDEATGALYFDADGNGFGQQLQIATIEDLAALSATDFIVV